MNKITYSTKDTEDFRNQIRKETIEEILKEVRIRSDGEEYILVRNIKDKLEKMK
jgi:hypothetical protein